MFYDRLEDIFGSSGADLAARILAALAIVIITWIVRQLISSLVPRVVRRLTTWTKSRWDDRIAQALIPPVRFLVLIAGLGMALLALDLPAQFNDPAQAVLNALVAYGIVWAIFRLIDPLVEIAWAISNHAMHVADTDNLEARLTRILAQILKGVVVILGVAMVLESWGYDVAGLIAGLGITGLAVALAAQNTLENLLGYFVILADEPLKTGEYVVFGDVSGVVEHIGFRSTRIRVLDQSLITVPNKTIMNANITNWSRLHYRWINMVLGIEYSSSPDQVLNVVQAIRDMLRDHDLTQADSVLVQFVNFNDSSLDLLIRAYVNTPDYGDFQAAKQDINLRIMNILAEHGVGVAFPSRTVYVEQVQSPTNEAAQIVPQPDAEPEIEERSTSHVPDEAND